MKSIMIRIAAALAVCAPAAAAVPQAQVAEEVIHIPFYPPLDDSLRYRWEKSVQQDGKTLMNWSVSDYRFDETDDGYRLSVVPVSSGSNQSDPSRIAIEKKIDSLIKIPFVLRLDADAVIVELENEGHYWAAISTALREYFDEKDRAENKPAEKQAIEAVAAMFEKMPPEVRLAMLTQSIQPLVEFGNTELTLGSPIIAQIDSETPFGGTIKQDVVVSLTKVSNALAHLSIRATIPKEELDKAGQALVAHFASSMAPEEVADMKAGLAGLKDLRKDSVADYQVSTVDGMLESMVSTETIEVSEADHATRKVTTITITRVH